jgi:DNA-binding NarL/FixJ family response regulator
LASRIFIADDHPTIRKVLRALIEGHAGWEVCGEAENGFEALSKVAELKPDLVIMDLAMPVMDGIRAAREISATMPGMPILMHTMHGSPAVNLEAKKAGVTVVVSKGESGENLIRAIEQSLKAGLKSTAAAVGLGAETAPGADSKAPETEKPRDTPPSAPDVEEPSKPD